MPAIAISTGWQPNGELDGIFDLLESSGVDRIEMHRMASSGQIQELLCHCRCSGTKIASLHALLEPYRTSRANCAGDYLASYSSRRVSKTIDLLKRSLAFCEQNNIPYLVMHIGFLETAEIKAPQSLSLARGVRLPPSVIKRRIELGKPILGRLITVMSDLGPQFPDVKLAIENRNSVSHFPLPDELAIILAATSKNEVGYWHDMAHARGYERLTGFRRREWLKIAGNRAWGSHVQDSTTNYQEHMPLGCGDDLINPETIGTMDNWVLEVSDEHSARSIRDSIGVLRRIASTVNAGTQRE